MIKKNRAFTLIELIVVLVILAVVALISTPIILNIVAKAKDSANKRSVDAYGKAIELAIAEYLLDTGDYPNTIDDLEIKYSGNEVACNVKKINDNGTVYLSECRVDGVLVKDDNTKDNYYHYDSNSYKSYKIGDKITYNDMEFYVIANSDENSDSVTLLKAESLTVDEVNTYGAGHVNEYSSTNSGTAYDKNGYGGMAYYSSDTCRYAGNGTYLSTGCTSDYEQSEVKHVVDAWTVDKFDVNDLTEDSLGYKTRLLTFEELTTNLGYTREDGATFIRLNPENTPIWVYNSNYYYWTMSPCDDSISYVWNVNSYGDLYGNNYHRVDYNDGVVRPVITLYKKAIN